MPNWLKTARSSNRRLARNFSNVEAQKRLDETVAPFHNQIENALYVDGVEAIVFKQSEIGRPCTCKKIPATEEIDSTHNVPTETQPIVQTSSDNDGISFDMGGPDIFGESGQEKAAQHGVDQSCIDKKNESRIFEIADGMSTNNGEGVDQFEPDTDRILGFEDGLFSGSAINCGICYRTGVTPPYEPLNHTMYTLTNYDARETNGMTMDWSAKPARFEALVEQSWVRFEINVPKYYKYAKYSIRDNLDIIKGAVFYVDELGQVPLSQAYMDENRGRPISIYVRGEDFTHAMIFFENNSSPLMVNMSQENETLDYSRESTIGNVTVVAPKRIGFIQNADMIVLPTRNLTLKVVDAPRVTTAQKTILQWQLETRAVQSSESIKNIFKGYKIR